MSAELGAAALDGALRAGAQYAEFRLQRTRNLDTWVRDGNLVTDNEVRETGIGVRVLRDGVWGYAASATLDPASAARTGAEAAALARALRPLRGAAVELADEPPHRDASWRSGHVRDPFEVDAAERAERLHGWCATLTAGGADHADARVIARREDTYYASTAGSSITQRKVWVHPMVTAVRSGAGGAFDTMRTLAPPTARGWEYLDGDGWDWQAELAELPELLAAKLAAPRVPAGTYDLVIDPTNLWLTIHESVGHATELDRALGTEAGYAGTSFATPDQLGTLRYGTAAMHVVADRTADHGLATVGYDDEGVAAQQWDLVRDGVLVGYQTDRAHAAAAGLRRSNGCAYADSFTHPPVQRMPNVSLLAAPGGPSTQELIGDVRDGIYVVGDKSWSIDMQRFNFQFTGQRFYRIRDGRLAGQVRDLAYQGSTTQFWGSLEAVGGPQTYLLSGASRCGKAQPLQIAATSHGCPAALFRGVRIIDTAAEADT
jgi:TldD protein